jgi:hypothetical protein
MEFYQKHIMKLQRSISRWADSSRIRKIIRLAKLSSYTWVTLFLLMLASCKVTHVVKCECKCPLNESFLPNVSFLPNYWDRPFNSSGAPVGDSTWGIRPIEWYQKGDTSNSEFHIPFDSSKAKFKIFIERNFKNA